MSYVLGVYACVFVFASSIQNVPEEGKEKKQATAVHFEACEEPPVFCFWLVFYHQQVPSLLWRVFRSAQYACGWNLLGNTSD